MVYSILAVSIFELIMLKTMLVTCTISPYKTERKEMYFLIFLPAFKRESDFYKYTKENCWPVLFYMKYNNEVDHTHFLRTYIKYSKTP